MAHMVTEALKAFKDFRNYFVPGGIQAFELTQHVLLSDFAVLLQPSDNSTVICRIETPPQVINTMRYRKYLCLFVEIQP